MRLERVVWQRWDVSGWREIGAQQSGSGRTVWLEEPGTGQYWLHKDTLVPANGIEQGEDWSEAVSTHVATLLGVPCAATQLCLRNGRRGSLSRSVVPKRHHFWEGHVVMEAADLAGYFPNLDGKPGVDPTRPSVRRPGHTLANIRAALEGIAAPDEFQGPPQASGFDVFTGFMILDALIANPDRHEQNWAVIAPPLTSAVLRLSPSYDHASSLGYNLTDAHRALNLDPSRLVIWAAKGRAARFEHVGKADTLVRHAAHALELCAPGVATWWRQQVAELDLGPVLEPLRRRRIPGMSDLAATFAHDLLELNLRRLNDAIRIRA